MVQPAGIVGPVGGSLQSFEHRSDRALRVRVALTRATVLALSFWALSEGRTAAFGFGALLVVLATALSLKLAPKPVGRLRARGLLALIAFFLVASFRGGVDVARRVFAPTMPLSPIVLRYESSLPELPLQLFASLLSLTPGTLSLQLEPKGVELHVLSHDDPSFMDQVRALERHVAAAFGLVLKEPADA